MAMADEEKSQVTRADLAIFTRQLGAMLAAGVNVLRALRIASHYTGDNQLIGAAQTIARYMGDGREFHQAISRHPSIFDAFYVEMARQGEADGTLGQALLAVADYLDHSGGGAVVEEAPVARGGTDTGVVAAVMSILGVLAVGAAVIWSVAAADLIPEKWLYPLAAFWSGVCLLAGAWLLRRITMPKVATVPALPTLPPKTSERRAAETEAIVRSALQEQQEEQEQQGFPEHAPGKNGKKLSEEASYFPDEAPPRFDL